MNRAFVLVCLPLLSVVLITGCLPNYFPRHHLKEALEPKDVIGTWYLSHGSIEMLGRYRTFLPEGVVGTLQLSGDGSCRFKSLDEEDGYLSLDGTWELLHNRNINSRDPTKNTLRLELWKGSQKLIRDFSFARKHGTVLLWTYHGDPDGAEYIDYSREHER